MAWNWSHTSDAYDNARANLGDLDRETLDVIFAEWEAYVPHVGDEFNQELYQAALVKARALDRDTVEEIVWDEMRASARCENGGHDAWACPFGCGPHLVSFDGEGV